MKFYKEEKKRIGSGRWGVIVAMLLFYFVTVQRELSMMKPDMADLLTGTAGKPTKTVAYGMGIWMPIALVILVCYLNDKLFFIEEQRKKVYLIQKYEMTPIRTKTLYQIKFWIIFESVLLFIMGTVGIYFFAVKANHFGTAFSQVWHQVGYLLIFSMIFTAMLVLVRDVYQGEYLSRKG